MTQDEILLVDGGGIKKAVAGVGGCVLIAAGGVSVIVGAGVAIGTGGTAIVPGVALACAGVSAITSGAGILDNAFK